MSLGGFTPKAPRAVSKAEPNFRRTFLREEEAFYFFDPQTVKLRHSPPE